MVGERVRERYERWVSAHAKERKEASKAAAVACSLQGMGELANAPWPPIREVGRSLASYLVKLAAGRPRPLHAA